MEVKEDRIICYGYSPLPTTANDISFVRYNLISLSAQQLLEGDPDCFLTLQWKIYRNEKRERKN